MQDSTPDTPSIEDLLHMARHVGSGYSPEEIAHALFRGEKLFTEQTAKAHETFATRHRPAKKSNNMRLQYIPDVLLIAAHKRGERNTYSDELRRRKML